MPDTEHKPAAEQPPQPPQASVVITMGCEACGARCRPTNAHEVRAFTAAHPYACEGSG